MITFEPSDIVRATNGAVSQDDLRNWIRNDRFNTPLDEPRAGKPRRFPVIAVYEAALIRELSAYGVPLDRVKAWNKAILDAISQKSFATVLPSGSQMGPKASGAAQIVLFHRGSDRMHLLTDMEAGETLNMFFYRGRDSGPAGSLAAVHLPALLSPICRELGIEPSP